jgi:hypothetical protein
MRYVRLFRTSAWQYFSHCAFFIWDEHTATPQRPNFVYLFNKYTYWIFQDVLHNLPPPPSLSLSLSPQNAMYFVTFPFFVFNKQIYISHEWCTEIELSIFVAKRLRWRSKDTKIIITNYSQQDATFVEFIYLFLHTGHAVAQLVEALRYKPESHGFDSRWCHWNFSFT